MDAKIQNSGGENSILFMSNAVSESEKGFPNRSFKSVVFDSGPHFSKIFFIGFVVFENLSRHRLKCLAHHGTFLEASALITFSTVES